MKKILKKILIAVLIFALMPLYLISTSKATTEKQKTVTAYDISLDDNNFWKFCDHLSKNGDTGGVYDSYDEGVGYMGHYGITTRHLNNESKNRILCLQICLY